MDTSRRLLLAGLGLGAAAAALPARANAAPRKKLLTIFLRGGADALSLVPPVYDPDYRAARPRTHLQEPGTVPLQNRTVAEPLTAEFGIHPALEWMKSQFDGNRMAIVHAAGAPSPSRSHFHMQAAIERAEWAGVPQSAGWMARYLEATETGTANPLRGVGIGHALPVALRGGRDSISMRDLADLEIPARSVDATALRESLRALHDGYAAVPGSGQARIEQHASTSLGGMDKAGVLRDAPYETNPEADYPGEAFGADLALAARLIKQDALSGTELLSVDLTGWDTHDFTVSRVAARAAVLDQGLRALHVDLGAAAADVTIVVMSEFGRRIGENASFGADHGSAGCMFVIGDAILGGLYAPNWPGLVNRGLTDIAGQGFRGDLMPMVDYRQVLAEVLTGPMGLDPALLGDIFPGIVGSELGLAA